MSIKNDRWIRRMAGEHQMIEPFSAKQVRTADGHKIVSYGTSSYGYDVRCAEDFKIFTNINSTIVDPKAFDEKSFIDFKGAVCIIPPNSFALASTVEYFRIPRSVLTVCLGKCLTGDTRVIDAESGAYLPITEMRWGKSTLAWNGRRLERAKVSALMPQGEREVFELRTASGLKIRATANHPFLTVKSWLALSDLEVGERIAVAREIPVFGKTPIPDRQANQLGLNLRFGAAASFVPQCIFTAPEASVRIFLRALFSGEGSWRDSSGAWLLEYRSNARRLVEDVHHLLLRFGILSLIRDNLTHGATPAYDVQITDQSQMLHFAKRIGFDANSAKRRSWVEEAMPAGIAAYAGRAGMNASVAFSSAQDAPGAGPVWDTVAGIEPAGSEEVFDITVPGLHNFVANDLIVHNSTYARCFRGDTRVALVDGESPTLEEMARRHGNGESFWGYSIGHNGRIVARLLQAPRFIGRDSLLEVELDNGARIHATPDHLFMRRDGSMAPANELRPNDALMPLYRHPTRDGEELYQPFEGFLHATHRLAAGKPGGAAAYRNHSVAAVREIPGDHDVYCLTVPGTGNFALQSGVFVHNCGIIVNVTPLEPEWEGHVTLEFSNTTTLPAKIYANEGVAQMLFFESDEVCETSYKDRGGKYQGQRGVTLPKT